MNGESQIQLGTTSILNVPLQIYDNDFTFIVNGEEFKTSRIISDILSPKISAQHQNDPTIKKFTIKTKSQGHFSYILQLANFNKISLPHSEITFFSEVIEILGNKSIIISNIDDHLNLTEENVISQLTEHELFGILSTSQIDAEIEFISSHFSNLYKSKLDKLESLKLNQLDRIISSPNLLLEDEDQLLNFINKIYEKYGEQSSYLYGNVLFSNCSESSISHFIDIFDYNDMTCEVWRSITYRLKKSIEKEEIEKRYIKKAKSFSPLNESSFGDGILNFFRKVTNDKIGEKVEIKASSFESGRHPSNVVIFEETEEDFATNDDALNHWISFEFKENSVAPTAYKIMSFDSDKNMAHLKSWVIEGSNDNKNWEIIDSQNDCDYLNGSCLTHLFNISDNNSKEFRIIRLRQTGKNWFNNYYLTLNSFELYGKLI